MQNDYSLTNTSADESALRQFINGMLIWMAIGLLITGVVAFAVYSTPSLINAIASSRLLFFGLIIGELVLVFTLARKIFTMSYNTGMLLFLLYAAINGLTLSIIFVIYTMESIANVFFVTAAVFGIMAVYGFITKKDLSSWGNILFMGLIGIIIASLANFLFQSTTLYWIITYAGVLLFVGLTAYDTQKMKKLYLSGQFTGQGVSKLALYGALRLYLDFINLFIMLLRILGRRR